MKRGVLKVVCGPLALSVCLLGSAVSQGAAQTFQPDDGSGTEEQAVDPGDFGGEQMFTPNESKFGEGEIFEHNAKVFQGGFTLSYDTILDEHPYIKKADKIFYDQLDREFRAWFVDEKGGYFFTTRDENIRLELTSVLEGGDGGRRFVFSARQGNRTFALNDRSLKVFTIDGNRVPVKVQSAEDANLRIFTIVLVDKSGSMDEFMNDVTSATKSFLAKLPEEAECRLVFFDTRQRVQHGGDGRNCNSLAPRIGKVEAGGMTDLSSPLADAYDFVSQNDTVQGNVVVISDGLGNENASSLRDLKKKKNAVTHVYWMGDYEEDQLKILGDNFIYNTKDLDKTISKYFESVVDPFSVQTVVTVPSN